MSDDTKNSEGGQLISLAEWMKKRAGADPWFELAPWDHEALKAGLARIVVGDSVTEALLALRKHAPSTYKAMMARVRGMYSPLDRDRQMPRHIDLNESSPLGIPNRHIVLLAYAQCAFSGVVEWKASHAWASVEEWVISAYASKLKVGEIDQEVYERMKREKLCPPSMGQWVMLSVGKVTKWRREFIKTDRAQRALLAEEQRRRGVVEEEKS